MNWRQASTGALLALLVVSIQAEEVAKDPEMSVWVSNVGEYLLEVVNLTQTPVDIEIPADELKHGAITFHLFTVSNPLTAQVIDIDDPESLKKSNFKTDKPTRILIHGWHNSVQSIMTLVLRNAYLDLGEYNVLGVDWNYYARGRYTDERENVFAVGQYVGQMLNYLESDQVNLDDVHLIGHSFGAHVAGVASRSANHKVAAIVALDPAGPLFKFSTPSRLTPTDAKFVEVVHTSAGSFGHGSKLGTVDIWPNGGEKQPGCEHDPTGKCSHEKAWWFFWESLTAETPVSSVNYAYNSHSKFIARRCESYDLYLKRNCASNKSIKMGGSYLDTKVETGDYYLVTNAQPPLARDEF